MSDNEQQDEKPFAVEKAKTGRAKCKKCKAVIEKDTIRIAKLVNSPFSEGKMKAWHHVDCLFDVFAKQRATTKRIDDPEDDIDGWNELSNDDKKIITDKLNEFENNTPYKNLKRQSTQSQAGPSSKKKKPSNDTEKTVDTSDISLNKNENKSSNNPDDSFRSFRRLCVDIANASAYTEKTACIKKMFQFGSSEDGFEGDILLWCKLLLPMATKRVYHLQSKQLIKLFSRIFGQHEDDMLEDYENGDIAETIMNFLEKNTAIQYAKKSILTLQEVDNFLNELTQLTTEDTQTAKFKSIIKRCTPNDLKMIIRFIKNDLRIKCGPKHVLEAIHEDAYRTYQHSNNLEEVVKKFTNKSEIRVSSTSASTSVSGKGKVALMTPVLPMLAEACKSVEMAIKKCPNGMLSEIKYDGERVQVHKNGNKFSYFSRSLKSVMPHKVTDFEKFIPKAFPNGDDLILDSEIIMTDRTTGQLLPFGSLGGKKTKDNPNINVCIFIFDCIYYNGVVLLNKTMKERRKILEKQMTIIPNRVMLSEVQEIHDPQDLSQMIAKVLRLGLEGLVLKPTHSIYEPGKRHWLKVKKDYLFDGAMADTVDLVVLGAWYGTGRKGGMKSIFLMGCYDEDNDIWLTVTKVHSGHDDDTLAKLQDQLKDMIKISKDPYLLPKWIKANNRMVPDFIAKDPKTQPVWEITGAEFTNQGCHTADSISIRFPRVTKIRDDKNWSTATTLKELKVLFSKSSDSIDFSLLAQSSDKKKKKTTLDHFLNINNDNSVDTDEQCENKNNENEIIDVENLIMNKKTSNNNSKAAFHAVIDNDSTGNTSNWIEDRKPINALPENAKPRSEKCDTKVKRKGILSKFCIILDDDIPINRRKVLKQKLTTLGAEVEKKNNSPSSNVTHIIHGINEITISELRIYELPLAKHVTESWIDAIETTSMLQNEKRYAVTLVGEYCSCSCTKK
ncbi:hypothetical protein HCN44_000250 [Aphidius gifuensis]|uniref:DNA ligase n=3 Tax=Aphidius gifuensis TaxID=684658 RepID=A0A834XRK3_APHGI|nr:hypothetical protein HCN44_000250 [Aphidius gifuensis]